MMSATTLRRTVGLALLGGVLLLAGCERPPVNTVQSGFRGTGMEQVYNPRILAEQAALNTAPPALPPASPDGPKAGTVYQNVKVLGDLSVPEFARNMVSITNWVAPKEGCTYCHAGANFADDSKYQKVVARKMLQMTQHINGNWKSHVGNTGVTCYTCHRGQNIPSQLWFEPLTPQQVSSLAGSLAGQNQPAEAPALASLPSDPFTPLLSKPETIRVIGTTALPEGNRHSTKQAEWTYSLMMHMSKSLGVNCTFCHNSRSFAQWDASTPQRSTAWYGIRMAGNLNEEYLKPLTSSFPANRLGPMGDVAKINCATCHQGAYKPLYGAAMAKDHPELASLKVMAAATAGPATQAASGGAATFFFDVGSAALPQDATGSLSTLLAALKDHPDARATISGYHSAAGELAANQELAKQRAFAVRDALAAAGIDASRIVLEKPVQAEANLAGEDPKARRVEVAVQ